MTVQRKRKRVGGPPQPERKNCDIRDGCRLCTTEDGKCIVCKGKGYIWIYVALVCDEKMFCPLCGSPTTPADVGLDPVECKL